MSDFAAFLILGIVALAVGWPTWTWAVCFGLCALWIVTELSREAGL